ncbi:ABC transporter ATP-binding protein [Actinomadura rugatobispora]|uniref:ABC transporter ATP-binding protein n=1 Tax=Actinomadura rugatobispora TaxID=1994 RepID=A0ABW0ZR52_9ACTN|nr:dipeptide ABC transporter ATP-binding protein [Actinomadura rugatobispora]
MTATATSATGATPSGDGALLEVTDLRVHYKSRSRAHRRLGYDVRAVDGISFAVAPGETLGLVGESGCGKSTTGRAVLQLVKPTGGTVRFDGVDVTGAGRRRLLEVRRGLQVVFQDPYDSLNPRMKVGDIVAEPLAIHGLAKGEARRGRVGDLLELVGLGREMMSRRPSELSGGQRQRVCIAKALAVNPKFIVCDEAVSALDVSVQAQVLNLLRRLQRELGLSYLFIGHDLSVVRHISDRVAVMYAGRLVESAASEPLYERPYHPYTVSLLASSPVPDPRIERDRPVVPVAGEPPSQSNLPAGCRFAARCPLARDRCRAEAPAYTEVEPGRMVACHFWREVRDTPARAGAGAAP